MKLDLEYGGQLLRFEVPDRSLLAVLRPKDSSLGCSEAESQIETATRLLRDRFRDFVASAHRLLLVVNDHTRPTPNELLLSVLEPQLQEKEIQILVACGSHARPTVSQLQQLLGRYAERFADRIVIHDARDQAMLRFLGRTRRGTQVWVNELLFHAERIIVVNSVEPHYFAGYTGGRKSILPGVAGLTTITANHKLALDPGARTLVLDGNPVHEDMTEAARMVPRQIFSIQAVVDDQQRLRALKFGDLFQSFAEACVCAESVFCVPIRELADIVVAVSRAPYDINFYQQQKALENARLAVKPGGILIGISSCRQGLGDDPTFIDLLSSCTSPAEVIERIRRDFVLGYHKSAKLAELMLTCELWTVVGIADEVVRSIFMRPFHDVNEAFQTALAKRGPGARVIVMPDASLTVPLLERTASERAAGQ